MAMYLSAVFACFYVLRCSKYVLECRKYVLECRKHSLKQSKCTVITTCYLFHQKGVELCRSLKIYVEGTGLSLRSGRPLSENVIFSNNLLRSSGKWFLSSLILYVVAGGKYV